MASRSTRQRLSSNGLAYALAEDALPAFIYDSHSMSRGFYFNAFWFFNPHFSLSICCACFFSDSWLCLMESTELAFEMRANHLGSCRYYHCFGVYLFRGISSSGMDGRCFHVDCSFYLFFSAHLWGFFFFALFLRPPFFTIFLWHLRNECMISHGRRPRSPSSEPQNYPHQQPSSPPSPSFSPPLSLLLLGSWLVDLLRYCTRRITVRRA